MRIFLRYLFWLLSLGTLVIFYFLNTLAGHHTLEFFLEDYLSKKTYNKIKIHSLDIEQYPCIVINLQVNDTANVLLEGEVSEYDINMSYHLLGDSLKFNTFYLEEKMDIKGELLGSFSALKVTGKGEVFEGEVEYDFIKIPTKIKDINFKMQQVNIQKILHFFKEKGYLFGLADIDGKFNSLEKYKKEGEVKLHMDSASMPKFLPNISFSLDTVIDFNGIEYKGKGSLYSEMGRVTVTDGTYHKSKKVGDVNYTLHLKDLTYFERFFKHRLSGSLDTKGHAIYKDGELFVKGHTDKFEGDLTYLYEKENIHLQLEDVSLEKILDEFSFPILFSSRLYGKIDYDTKDEIVLIDTDLRKTHFRKTTLSNMLYTKADIDLLADVYDKSSFMGGYKNSTLFFILKIDDGESHIYLKDTKLNALSNQVTSNFEIKMQGQEIYGNIYGTLKDPKVSVDMQRLLKYQVKKRFGDFLGTKKLLDSFF